MMPFNDPNMIMQMLANPNLDPMMLQQIAGQLAMKAPAPSFQGMQPMQPIGQFSQPPGAAQLPPGSVMSGMDGILPGETGGMPNRGMGVLDPKTMAAFSQMLSPQQQFLGNPAPPAPRGLTGNMAQLQAPGVGMPPSLAQLLGMR